MLRRRPAALLAGWIYMRRRVPGSTRGHGKVRSARKGRVNQMEIDFEPLVNFLARVPAVRTTPAANRGIGRGQDDSIWWVKFVIDIDHALAWHAVQEMGYVLNQLSLDEPLPTTFKPVSPPPYMNGGPDDFLSWVVECPLGAMDPSLVAQWLEARLPNPVEDPSQWTDEEEQ